MRKITFTTRLILSFVLTGFLVVLALAIGYIAAISIITLLCYGLSFVIGNLIASVMMFILTYAAGVGLVLGMWFSAVNFKRIHAYIQEKFAWAKLHMSNAWDATKYYATNPKELWSVTKTACINGALATLSFIKSIPARIKSVFTRKESDIITNIVTIEACAI